MSDFYFQRPLVVEALQYDGKNYAECREFAGYGNVGRSAMGGVIEVGTTSGHVSARPGDWLVRGGDGAVRPVDRALFAESFAAVVKGDDDSAA